MLFMLDNYDSFVYNLYAYFKELGQDIIVKKPCDITIEELEKMNLDGIIISPGPGKPIDSLMSLEIIDHFKGKVPILGVCLGHQVIGHYFGANVTKGKTPMHGKISPITHNNKDLFDGLPKKINVTRYHSLIVEPTNITNTFDISALSDDNVVMAITHKNLPIYGVQFHPEACLSEYGHEMLRNFTAICKDWRVNL